MENIKLQYPVVLVHGIHAHDRQGSAKFWGRIPDMLTGRGIQVFLGNTDAWGEYESNASILKETIEKVLLQTKKEKVNIIAHSKGGIDSRYLLWKYNFAEKTASLTTICTPHHGSEIADLLFKQKIIHTKTTRKALEIFGKIYGDSNPNIYDVNRQLTTGSMEGFNKSIPMDNKVYFQSLYTAMNNAFDDLMFFYTYLYIKKLAGNNDGLVSENSAHWGNNARKLQNGISHADILDTKKKNFDGISVPDLYADIVKDLSERGF